MYSILWLEVSFLWEPMTQTWLGWGEGVACNQIRLSQIWVEILRMNMKHVDKGREPRSHVLLPVLLAPNLPMSSPPQNIPTIALFPGKSSSTCPCDNQSLLVFVYFHHHLSPPTPSSIFTTSLISIEMPTAPCGCHHFLVVLRIEFSRCFMMLFWSLQLIY